MVLGIYTSYADNNDLLFNNLKSYCMFYGQHANLNALNCLYICLKPINGLNLVIILVLN